MGAYTLVAVDERMILRKSEAETGGFLGYRRKQFIVIKSL